MKDPSKPEVTLRFECPNDLYHGRGPLWLEASLVGAHLEVRSFEEGPDHFWPPSESDLDMLISSAELVLSDLRKKHHDRAMLSAKARSEWALIAKERK